MESRRAGSDREDGGRRAQRTEEEERYEGGGYEKCGLSRTSLVCNRVWFCYLAPAASKYAAATSVGRCDQLLVNHSSTLKPAV